MKVPRPKEDADEPRAHARRTDPETSHEAAASVDVRQSQQQVLAFCRRVGPGSFQQLYAQVDFPISTSGFRTRISELCDMDPPLMRWNGEYTPSMSGGRPRRCQVWEVVE